MDNKQILVMKFGGTSVGSADAITQAAAIIKTQVDKWDHVVVVVSAMRGITDGLLKSARAAVAGDERYFGPLIEDLRKKHHTVIDDLIQNNGENIPIHREIDQYIEELTVFCRSIHVMGEVTPRGFDVISSLGERMNARVVAAVMRHISVPSQAVDATHLIVTDNTFQDAIPLMDATREKTNQYLAPLFEAGVTPIVTGFIGATEDGIITTLGRGGSDYTSAIMGESLDASEVWTLTDVDGVMTADPRIVPEAQVIPELSYSEVGELAYFGAKVLHPKTIRPVIRSGIPLWVKNTFNPQCTGTRISEERTTPPGMITAITTIKNLSMITVEGRGMLGVPGIAARTFKAVASSGTSVLMISQSSSEQSICFVIPTVNSPEVIRALEEELALELVRRDIDRVWAQDDTVILTTIGAGLRHTPGVSARVFGALGRANINVVAIAQGSSEYCMSIVVEEKDANNAIRGIHKEIIEVEAQDE